VETDHGKMVMGRWLGSSTTTVVVTFGGAPAPRVGLAMAAQAGTPPPSVESAQEVLARRIEDASSVAMVARVWAKISMG
jgi:hypothetical protein